jgi:hypothetical protein
VVSALAISVIANSAEMIPSGTFAMHRSPGFAEKRAAKLHSLTNTK